MRAVEFETKVENGVIPIPFQYQDSITDNVRVIVLSEEKAAAEPVKVQKREKIYSIGIDMAGYKFDREEANARR
ncbi:MAG: hypothetical protein LBC62_02155 [Treponema sp.]|jgi:hypothetical protein|nr:hypothetical protein [Treponema sp.]